MTPITQADHLIREAMKAETPELRHAGVMKAYFSFDFREDDIEDFVLVLAAHLTLVPVLQTEAA